MRTAAALALDTVLIAVFAAIGRRNHAETGALADVLATAWPFLAGMAVGWLISLLIFRRVPLRVREGVPVWLGAVALGMVLRVVTSKEQPSRSSSLQRSSWAQPCWAGDGPLRC